MLVAWFFLEWNIFLMAGYARRPSRSANRGFFDHRCKSAVGQTLSNEAEWEHEDGMVQFDNGSDG
jgi:hypothetical protein